MKQLNEQDLKAKISSKEISYDKLGALCIQLNQMVLKKNREEKELRQQVDMLQRSNADLEALTYIASHDIKAPIRSIASFVQLLDRKTRGKLDSDCQDYMTYIVDNAHRLNSMINDLISFAHITQEPTVFSQVDFGEVTSIVANNLSPEILRHKVQLEYDTPPMLLAYQAQIVSLMHHLIENSIKFQPEGQSPVIRISFQLDEYFCYFSIEDNGIGIDLQYKKKIFGVFQRLHNELEYPGNGIGLAMARRIVKRHGGRIRMADPQPEKGCRIEFSLPLFKMPEEVI